MSFVAKLWSIFLVSTERASFWCGFYRPHPKDDGRLYFQSVHTFGGGVPDPALDGGGTWSSLGQGGYLIQPWMGGRGEGKGRYPNLGWGGYPNLVGVPHFQGGTPSLGTPLPPSKGKIFWHQIWLDTCSDWKKNFSQRQPPPPSKGKNFWHQIWLDTCSDWKKKFSQRDPPLE